MKKCSKCLSVKTVEEFNLSTRSPDGRHTYCRDCSKAHYRENKERHLANVRKNAERYRSAGQSLMIEAFSSGCVDCGTTDIRVLEFDHVRGVKFKGVASLVRDGYPAATIVREIAKCEVRCRNCHTIASYERLGGSWHEKFLGL